MAKKMTAVVEERQQVPAWLLPLVPVLGKPEPEFRFARGIGRDWRFDWCWPEWRLGVEIEGAVFAQGRHTRGQGYTDDCEKYSMAAVLGWSLIRVTTGQVRSGEARRFVELWCKYRGMEVG